MSNVLSPLRASIARIFSTRSGKLVGIVILLTSLSLVLVQVQQVQNLLQNAQTPLTPPMTPPNTTKHPLSWKTQQVSLEADDFYLIADGKKFFGNDANVEVHSDPGSSTYTTLEATWYENGVEMRVNIYFEHKSGDFWKMSELRTYNGQAQGDWIYYKTLTAESFLGNTFGSPLILSMLDLASDPENPDNRFSGAVHFENLKLWPFLTYSAGPTPTETPVPLTVTVTPMPTYTPIPTRTPTPTRKVTPTKTPTPRPDRTRPRIQFIFPLNGISVKKGSVVAMQVFASDNKGVVNVTFFVNSVKICTDTTASASLYSCSWTVPNTVGVMYSLKAIAADATGNTTSSTIRVSAK